MRKSLGFTLIELVIVIVILGILGAVAAPKLIGMQSDAYRANLNALKMNMQSLVTLAHTKAILHGYDREHQPKADSSNDYKRDDVNGDIHFMYGFPNASGKGIIKMMQDAGYFSFDTTKKSNYRYTHRDRDPQDYTRLTIAPSARHKEGAEPEESVRCELVYQGPKKLGDSPEITLYTQGC